MRGFLFYSGWQEVNQGAILASACGEGEGWKPTLLEGGKGADVDVRWEFREDAKLGRRDARAPWRTVTGALSRR